MEPWDPYLLAGKERESKSARTAVFMLTFLNQSVCIFFQFLALDVEMNFSLCTRLTSLCLFQCDKVTQKLLPLLCPSAKPNRSLTSLDVTDVPFTLVSPVLPRLQALQKFILRGSFFNNGDIAKGFRGLENLEWLDLSRCAHVVGADLLDLSDAVGSTLRHLRLVGLHLITNTDLRDLASTFPVLRTLDLSGCLKISDASLVEWYLKNDETHWPKLKRLHLCDCDQITEEVISSVRHKTRNQLMIDKIGYKLGINFSIQAMVNPPLP